MSCITNQPSRYLIILLYFSLLHGLLLAEEPTAPSPKEPPPTASVQIINAISTPEVSLSINGKELYPKFPQAIYSADAPLPELKPHYLVADPNSKRSVDFPVELEPNTNQSLVMIGDFSIPEDPNLYLPGVLDKQTDIKATGPDTKKKSKPNILFLLFDHKLAENTKPLRYRIVNGMIGKSLTIDTKKEGKVSVVPGNFYELDSQEAITTIPITVQGANYPVLINQQGSARNALIIFFMTNNGPNFMRVFENTRKSLELIKD